MYNSLQQLKVRYHCTLSFCNELLHQVWPLSKNYELVDHGGDGTPYRFTLFYQFFSRLINQVVTLLINLEYVRNVSHLFHFRCPPIASTLRMHFLWSQRTCGKAGTLRQWGGGMNRGGRNAMHFHAEMHLRIASSPPTVSHASKNSTAEG